MADKPSRALVLYGDGLARFIQPSHTNLHSLASHASCGFLSLPNVPPSENEDERIVREFAVLLDSCEASSAMCRDNVECQKPSTATISERFMGMKAAVVTNNASLRSFCGKLGLSVLEPNNLLKKHGSQTRPFIEVLGSELLELLGFKDGKALDSNQFDLVCVHVGAGEISNFVKDKAVADDVEYINALVGVIMHLAQPPSEIGSRLHLSVTMSYGRVSKEDDQNLSVLIANSERYPNLSSLIPRQSYTMAGEKPRENVRHHSPMLLAQLQYGVTRKDLAGEFSFREFKERSGNLVIPADRLLHEAAFKLWKAPKYGA